MSERDRLAADLRATIPEWQSEAQDWWQTWADRLIALGWTRLDEERLARAIRVAYWAQGNEQPPAYATLDNAEEWYASPADMAAAIAKAYREDTE